MSDVGERAWSYRPGSWFGVFGTGIAVALPAEEKARAVAIWELVDAGAGFEETLDALIAGGLRGRSGFVLVAEEADGMRILVRGTPRVHALAGGEAVQVGGDPTATWVERTVSGVSRLVLGLEADGVDDLSVTDGLVRLAGAEWPAARVEAAAPVVLPPMPPPPPPPPPVVPAPDLVPDGDTHTGDLDPGQFLLPQPGIPGQPPAPSVTARPVARLVLSTGETVEVDRAVIIGRAPEARRFSSDEQPRLVTVPSPQQEISSTHLEIRPGSGADHGSAVVTDLGSTNGSLLVQPGLPPESLKAGVAVQLIPGAVVDLGDGLTIQVLNP